MTGPTQHADDRETRKLIASLPALRMSPDGQRLAVSTPHVSGTWFVVECFPDDRSDFGYVDSVKVADWVAVAKSAVGEITEAHTRNAVLRSEHRTEVERLRAELTEVRSQNAFLSEMLREAARQGVIVEASEAAAWESSRAMAETADVLSLRLRGMARKVVATRAELHEAVEDWGRNDEQVLADSARLAEENERLRAELVAIGAQRDDAEDERTSMIRDLHAAQFDGATSLPDRPLDTVWEWLLDLVRNDRARLSGGNTPADAARLLAKLKGKAKTWAGLAAKFREDLEPHSETTEVSVAMAGVFDQNAKALTDLVRGWGSAVATPEPAADAIETAEDAAEDLYAQHGSSHFSCCYSASDAREVARAAVTALAAAGMLRPTGVATPADTQADSDGQLRRLVTDLQGARDVDLSGAYAAGYADGQVQAGNDLEMLLDEPAPSVGADPEDEVGAEIEAHLVTYSSDETGHQAFCNGCRQRKHGTEEQVHEWGYVHDSRDKDAALLVIAEDRARRDTGERHDLDEVLAELREDERQHAELNPKLAAQPVAVADAAHERTEPDA